MTLEQKIAWQRLSTLHPTPWYLEQSNLSGVEVKDNRGNTVYFEDLGSIPDEMPSGQAAKIREAADALGRFLVAFSQNETQEPCQSFEDFIGRRET